MPRPRFRLRTLLIAVAMVGGLMFVETMRRRSGDFRERAESHRAKEREIATEKPNASQERRMTYQTILSLKYLGAASCPWAPVPPDPPPPE